MKTGERGWQYSVPGQSHSFCLQTLRIKSIASEHAIPLSECFNREAKSLIMHRYSLLPHYARPPIPRLDTHARTMLSHALSRARI